VHSRRNPRQERTEAAAIPTNAATSENQACNNNLHGDLRQPSAPVAGVVSGVDAGNMVMSHLPCTRRFRTISGTVHRFILRLNMLKEIDRM